MDYKTKATSRINLRRYAVIMRMIFEVAQVGAFPVLYALEHLHDVFPDCNYLILEDTKFSPQTMARCITNEAGGFTIEIRQSVYDGAYEKQTGAFLGFICHEICHVLDSHQFMNGASKMMSCHYIAVWNGKQRLCVRR